MAGSRDSGANTLNYREGRRPKKDAPTETVLDREFAGAFFSRALRHRSAVETPLLVPAGSQ